MPTQKPLTVLRPWFVVPGYERMTANLRAWFGTAPRVADYQPSALAGPGRSISVMSALCYPSWPPFGPIARNAAPSLRRPCTLVCLGNSYGR